MTPREVIADAVSRSFYGQLLMEQSEYRQGICRDMADAVIDALEGMGISPEMDLAACKVSRKHELDLQPGDALALWQAMVGAMRDE